MIVHESVLVAEDDPDVRSYVATVLEHAGYEVRAVPDGRAALDILDDWRPGTVLVDLRMPCLDGWELCERLGARPDLAEVAVVVMSAPENLRRPVTGRRAVGVLEKPFGAAEVLATVWVASNP